MKSFRINNIKELLLIILIQFCLITASDAQDQASGEINEINWEAFPIITYDTDAGFGFGAKGYICNFFKKNESFDLILFNSTKGERWYRIQFSYPDYEIRHGTDYGYALDLIADYDKWINYYFYGIGNSSSFNNKKMYTREPFEINIILNKTITGNIILRAGIKYQTIKSTNFPRISLPPDYHFINKSDQFSFLINAVYDTRNSIINPSNGMTIVTGIESSPSFAFTNSSLSKALLTFQSYNKIIFPDLIFAERVSLQQLIGNNIPVQFLLPMGGNETLRGYAQDRFLDRSSTLINIELRFPIWKRLGGIAGLDAGRVFPSLKKFTLSDWNMNVVAGLRFYMNNFVVRADLGISKETTGFYFNFGHIF